MSLYARQNHFQMLLHAVQLLLSCLGSVCQMHESCIMMCDALLCNASGTRWFRDCVGGNLARKASRCQGLHFHLAFQYHLSWTRVSPGWTSGKMFHMGSRCCSAWMAVARQCTLMRCAARSNWPPALTRSGLSRYVTVQSILALGALHHSWMEHT